MTDPTAIDLAATDDVLDIDGLLAAADVHLAEKTIGIYLRPDLEAVIDALELELASITDGSGATAIDVEAAVGEAASSGGRSATEVAEEIQAVRRQYGASRKTIRVRQLNDEDWPAFEAKHKKAIAEGSPYPVEMWNDLISQSAIEPRLPLAKVQGMRAKLGSPQMMSLAMTCWDMNTRSGVSVPFSRLSSDVLKPNRPARN